MPGLTRTVSVVVILAAAAVAGNAAEEPPTVRVTGVGKVSAIPDLVEISIGVTSQAPTAQVALALNNKEMTTLFEALKANKIAEKDIQTSQIQVNPQYSVPPQQPREDYVPRVIGYRVSNSVNVKVRQVSALGPLLDVVIKGGMNQINGIHFKVADSEKLLDQARTNAVMDAKRKAEQLAKDAGIKLGPVRQILEGEATYPNPQPLAFSGRAMMMAAPTMPVSAGEQELQISVTMTFGIQP